jgi:hypothetical protein
MKHRQLTEYPEYVRIRTAVDKLRSEQVQLMQRMNEITAELMKPKRKIDGQEAWDFALEGGDNMGSMAIDSKSVLREEYGNCEGELRFIEEALATGTMELDKVHGAACREICETVRFDFVGQIRRILTALKQICEANEVLEKLRSDLEAAGVRTDSLPAAVFDNIGPWDDPHGYGGLVPSYRKYVAEHYPELESARSLRRQLADKILSFEKQEEA